MDWARVLAYVTGTVDQELLARNEYLAAENRILKAQLNGRLDLPMRSGELQRTRCSASVLGDRAGTPLLLRSGLGCSAAIPLAPRARYRHRSLSTSIVYGRVGL